MNAEPPNSMIGKTVSHYKILEKLGEGGTGVVYRAQDLRLHRMVAIKFPSDGLVHGEEIKARFLNEARMASALIHQNVAVTHDVGEYEGKPFIVMEFVDGHSLRHALHESGPFPLDRFLDFAVQICRGLGAVHEMHMLHRDIKSDNILLNSKAQVKIADCGLAARFVHDEGLVEKLGIAGTSAYMSPEQARGDALDQRSDLFSLGVVFYEMLTGKLPFDAEHPAVHFYLLAHAEPEPLAIYRSDVPPRLAGVISKLLEKDPSRRYQCVADVIADLARVNVIAQA